MGTTTGRGTHRPVTVAGVDLHTLITWLLTIAVVIVLVVRGRAKRSDRKREEERSRPGRDADGGRSLY